MSEIRSYIASVVLCISLVAVAGCAAHPPVFEPTLSSHQLSPRVELIETPFFAQTKYYCGPASLAAILNHSGIQVEPHDLAPWVYLPKKRGSLQIELLAATRQFNRIPYPIAPDISGPLNEINAGRPVLVLLNLGWRKSPVWHYAVIVGYETIPEQLILRSGKNQRKLMSAKKFLKAWTKADKWGFVALRPGEMPATDNASRYLEAVASLESVGRYNSALPSFAAATKRWPENTMAQFGLGNTLYALGRLVEAERAFRNAIRIEPEMVTARNNLAHILAQRGCLEQALEQIDIAISVDSGPANVHDVLTKTRNGIKQQLNANPKSVNVSCAAQTSQISH